MKPLSLLAAALLFLSLHAAVYAQAGPTPAPRKPVWQYQQELGLSDSQVAMLKGTFNTLTERRLADREKWQALQAKINKMFKQNADMAAIRTKVQAAADLTVDMQMSDLLAARTVHNILTPAQQARWDAMSGSRPSLPPPNQ